MLKAEMKEGVRVKQINNDEFWNNWIITFDGRFWGIKNESGEKLFTESDLPFYQVIK